MKHSDEKNKGYASITNHDARNQAKIAIILMSVIPALSLFYIGTVIGRDADQFTFLSKITIFAFIVSIAVSGYVILRKYPENIIKLRKHITDIAHGTLPDRVELIDSKGSDDIKYIENGINTILQEMQNRIGLIEEKLRVEQKLRETIEKQQETLLSAERNRVMIQSLGAACHHLGQPVTALKMQLYLMRDVATTQNELEEIEDCAKTVEAISSMLRQLQDVSAFATESYVHNGSDGGDEILKIA